MIFNVPYIYGVNFIAKFLWKSGFLWGFHGTPPWAPTGVKVPWSLKGGFLLKKKHPGHWDQGWTNLSKLGPYTRIDEPLFMTMKIPASVAPGFLDEICLISLI